LFIAGNWKLNCNIEEANDLASNILKNIKGKRINNEIVIFPPFTSLFSVSKIIKNTEIFLGGQDCSDNISGAFTGDISSEMLLDLGCKYVILGHSERRQKYNETNELIKRKSDVAQKVGLTSIICVGESLKDRELGKEKKVIEIQLKNSIPETSNSSNCIIAYEPIWAIGSGKTPTISKIIEMFGEIKQILNSICINDGIKILYGGSVNISNSFEILSNEKIDGALIGGASLNAEDFSKICLEANKLDGKI